MLDVAFWKVVMTGRAHNAVDVVVFSKRGLHFRGYVAEGRLQGPIKCLHYNCLRKIQLTQNVESMIFIEPLEFRVGGSRQDPKNAMFKGRDEIGVRMYDNIKARKLGDIKTLGEISISLRTSRLM